MIGIAHITYRGIPLRVEFDHEEGQKLILRPDPNDCQEGIDPCITIETVTVGGVDITELFADEQHDELAALIAKQREDAV